MLVLVLRARAGVQFLPCERAHATEKRRDLLDELATPAPTEVHGGHRFRSFVQRDMDRRGFRRCDGNPVCGIVKAFEDPGVSLWVVNRMISNDIDTEIKSKEQDRANGKRTRHPVQYISRQKEMKKFDMINVP